METETYRVGLRSKAEEVREVKVKLRAKTSPQHAEAMNEAVRLNPGWRAIWAELFVPFEYSMVFWQQPPQGIISHHVYCFSAASARLVAQCIADQLGVEVSTRLGKNGEHVVVTKPREGEGVT